MIREPRDQCTAICTVRPLNETSVHLLLQARAPSEPRGTILITANAEKHACWAGLPKLFGICNFCLALISVHTLFKSFPIN